MDSVQSTSEVLIAVVAEKTGYPAEVLELDMRLDDDLGIDSIKRVEILSAMQERFPGRTSPPPDRLAGLQTLRAIAEFLADSASPITEREEPAESGDPRPHSDVARMLLETVAEKTGYPAEMLELDMRLDDDLGIDSIKRVEILSALQERYPELPSASPDRLGTLGTLREIADFLAGPAATGGENGAVRLGAAARASAQLTEPQANPDESVARVLLDAVAEKTGYPAEMLGLDMRLDDDLGIDSIKRVEILSAVQDRLPGTRSIGPEQTGTLRTLGEIVAFLASPTDSAPSVANGRPDSGAGAHDSRPHDELRVALRRFEPRAVPLASPERREAVQLPRGIRDLDRRRRISPDHIRPG